MPPKKKKPPAHGGPREGAGAPVGNENRAKGPAKKLVSARVLVTTYERLEAEAAAAGISISDLVARKLNPPVSEETLTTEGLN